MEASTLRTLNQFAVDLIQIPSTEDLFWYVAQNVVGRLNFVDCVIYQANEEQTDLRQVAAWGDKNPFGRNILNPLIIPFGRGITGKVAQTRRPVIVDDLLSDQNYIPDTRPARSEICVPLLLRGRVVGVIDSEHPDPQAFGHLTILILRLCRPPQTVLLIGIRSLTTYFRLAAIGAVPALQRTDTDPAVFLGYHAMN